MKIESSIIRVKDLSSAIYASMLGLMQEYYGNVTPDQFEADLQKKDVVNVLRSGEELCGFSTQVLHKHTFWGEEILVLYSGDTIIAAKYRNSMALPIAGGRMMLAIIEDNPGKPLYWLLTSKGYKTYKFLPVFFKEYYPSLQSNASEAEKRLIKEFCVQFFQEKFDQENWLIKADSGDQVLNLQDGEINEQRRKDPLVAFFEQRNPGHLSGDELVCFARFHQENLNPYIWKQLVDK